MTDEPQTDPHPDPTPPLSPTDPDYWQALIDSGYLARGLAALAAETTATVYWNQLEIVGTMRYLTEKNA